MEQHCDAKQSQESWSEVKRMQLTVRSKKGVCCMPGPMGERRPSRLPTAAACLSIVRISTAQ